ncbi:uncharacterized protein LOC141935317 [Strix uralensis]|uniref:uncharacterized protein LOC141935317 n=1 Tax=Strix uralensis TaxID=36305 RepID=UPI003DA78350
MVCQADVHLEQLPSLPCSLVEEGGAVARQAEGGEEPCEGRQTPPLQAQEEPSAQSAPWAFDEQGLVEFFNSALHIASESNCSNDPTERGPSLPSSGSSHTYCEGRSRSSCTCS